MKSANILRTRILFQFKAVIFTITTLGGTDVNWKIHITEKVQININSSFHEISMFMYIKNISKLNAVLVKMFI